MFEFSDRGKLLSLREVFVLLLLGLPLLVTASVIEAANWVHGLPSLKALALVPLVMWAYLARSSVSGRVGHSLAFLIGLIVAFILGSLTISGSGGLGGLASQLGSWFGAIGSSGEHGGTSMTGVFLIAVTLWMGHASVWLAYRKPLALLAALPGLGVLLVSLTFLPTDFYWYFFMYLLAAAPGIAYRYKGRWTVQSQRVPIAGTLVAAVALMGIALVPAWRAAPPAGVVIPLAAQVEDPWYSFQENWSDLFHGVPDRKDWPSFSPPHDLPSTGPIRLDDQTLFVVKSTEPHRWRMRVYDTYTGSGWESEGPVEEVDTTEGTSVLRQVDDLQTRTDVEIVVRLFSKSSTLISVGEPLGASIESAVEVSPQPSFKLYTEGSQLSYLPPELMEHRDGLTAMLRTGRELESRASLGDLGFEVSQSVSPDASATEQDASVPEPPYMEIKRDDSAIDEQRPVASLPTALLGQRLLVPPRQYSTVGSISTAGADTLRRTEQNYPTSITDRYLQLPHDFPETVRGLARELTRDEDNPYDMAEAIRRYLLSLSYSVDVVAPPPGQDWVEHFLLVHRKGYCQNYASAMITMLRSLGIPARLAVGFAPGVWDQGKEVWEVQARHYHAWPEVYFPDYGWIEFEPTPADVQPSLEYMGFRPQGDLVTTAPIPDGCIEIILAGEICEDMEAPADNLEDIFGDLVPPENDSSDLAASAGGGGNFLTSPWLFVIVGLVLALVVPVGTVSYIRRGLVQLGYPTYTYALMCFMGRLAGVGLRSQDTSWEYSSRLGQAFPEHAETITRITRTFVDFRYGPFKGGSDGETEVLNPSWPNLRSTLLRHALRRLVPHRRLST